MNVTIRNLKPSTVQDINEKAKQNNLSQQQYLKEMLEKMTFLDRINDREREYRIYLDKMYQMMRLTRDQLEKNTKALNLLMEDDA